jgi:hypothetical protein
MGCSLCGCCCRLLGLSVQHIAAELSTGKVYAAQHPDKQGRPVFVVRTCRHRQGEKTKSNAACGRAAFSSSNIAVLDRLWVTAGSDRNVFTQLAAGMFGVC